MAGRRFLALWFPHLPTDRLRLGPAGDGPASRAERPLVLVHRAGNALRLQAVCPRALALGLTVGLPLADARARMGGGAQAADRLEVADADPAADARLLGELAGQALRWSPIVAPEPPDSLLLDISGCAHLFGGEAGLAADVQARLAPGFARTLALAATPSAAWALARWRPLPAGASAEMERLAIGQLPVAALRLEATSELALRRAGLKRIADLADRPTAPLAARFGAPAVAALDRLLGRADMRLSPLRPAPALLFARRFAEPLGHVDGVRAALGDLAADACAALDRRGAGGRRFEALLCRTDGVLRALAVETGQPTRDPARIMRLFHERIEALSDPLDPGFGFDLLRLGVPVTEPLGPAQALLGVAAQPGEARSGETLQALIDRLAARHGRNQLLRLLPHDTHVPERAVRRRPAVETGPDGEGRPGWPVPGAGEPPTRPLLLFDPPQPVEAIAEVPDAPPRRFQWQGTRHDIVRAEGPERIAAPWWRAADAGRPTRDYYRVEDSMGRRFWLFRQGLAGLETAHPRWFLHGLFA